MHMVVILGGLFAMSAAVAVDTPHHHQSQPPDASAGPRPLDHSTYSGAAIDGSERLLPLLRQISDWALRVPLREYPANRSIFESGNLVRAVLAAHKITGDPGYLTFGLAWCDHLVSIQHNMTTSTGEHGGFWDTGMGEVYLADTGTAIAALSVCTGLQADPAKTRRYLAAMQRYGNVRASTHTGHTEPRISIPRAFTLGRPSVPYHPPTVP